MDNMTGRGFFYAQDDSQIYDWVIGRTQPEYERLHKVLAVLVGQQLEQARNEGRSASALDLGCGTGKECLAVLALCPWARVVALDASAPMLDILRGKVQRLTNGSGAPRDVDCVTGDITDLGTLTDPKLQPRFDLVVSSLAIHHLSEAEVRSLYGWIHERLLPGGVFANADLFDFANPELSRLAMADLEHWITTHLDPDDRQINPPSGVDVADQRDKWIHHVRHDNKIRPIEGLNGHAALLDDAGFASVAVPFRVWQTGIVWAQKAKKS